MSSSRLTASAGPQTARGALVCQTDGAGGATVTGAHVSAPAVTEVDPNRRGRHVRRRVGDRLPRGRRPVVAAERACAVAARSVTVLGAIEALVG